MTAHGVGAGRHASRASRLEEVRLSTQPGAARVVVIGAGIVGNSLVYHLARLGWTDIVQIEKGPLPNPGGSTGHASNFIFLTDHSREMTALTADSVEQYKEMGVFTQSGRHRGRPDARADGGAQAPDGVVALVGHRIRAADPGRGQGSRPVRQRRHHPRRLLDSRASAWSTRSARGRSCASVPRRWAPCASRR